MRRLALLATLTLAACYSPHPLSGSFTCDSDHGFLCPAGLQCDHAAGLCVKSLSMDLGAPDLVSPYDLARVPVVPTCDDHVRAGDFSNLTNLGAVNSAGDEHSLTLSTDGARLYFLDGSGALESATLSGKSVSAPQAVTCSGLPAALTGGTIAKDGSYWFTGANGQDSSLYVAAFTSPTQLAAPVQHAPSVTSGCAISDPFFNGNDSGGELYVAYPLGGCAAGSMIAQGFADKNLGAFIGAVAQKGVGAPTLTPSGLTLLMGSTGTGGRILFASRASTDDQWHGPNAIPLDQPGSIGSPAHRDVQALVSSDCKTLFLVSDRAGTKGGLDLWAADIAQ